MQIKDTKDIKSKLRHVIDLNIINMNVADMLNTAFSYTDIIEEDNITQYIKEGYTLNEAVIGALFEFYNMPPYSEENKPIVDEYFSQRLKELNPLDYLDNLYVKTIKETGRYGKYALKMIDYAPYQLFPYDEIIIGEEYQEYSAIGYFKKPFSYLALTEGNNIWMSLNPNEIETMKPYIEKGHGDVLVLGLGMGYVPFMLANKKSVKSITIIEKDQEIINLFNKLLYPHFINKEKIKIIKDDAINYVNKNKKYDYIFADLWHSPEDGIDLFIKLKRIDRHIDCWLETSLVALLRRCMITIFEEALENYGDDKYQHPRDAIEKVIIKYYQKTKNIVINDVSDIDHLLKEETLLDLIIH